MKGAVLQYVKQKFLRKQLSKYSLMKKICYEWINLVADVDKYSKTPLFNKIRLLTMQERILLRGTYVHQATAQSMARFEGVHPGFFSSYQVVAVVTKFLPVRVACDRIFETCKIK